MWSAAPPLQDSQLFRNRLAAFIKQECSRDLSSLAAFIEIESGVKVDSFHSGMGLYYDYSAFLTKIRIEVVLSVVTLVWRFLRKKYLNGPQAGGWRKFVARVLHEENMAYTLDELCGVHFVVDEEFERNRVTALSCLSAPRYAGVRAAFEQAHGHLDNQPPDMKASVHCAFESLEILTRLMVGGKNLNRYAIENNLKPLALAHAVDATEETVIGHLFDGLATAVDGLQYYRHGQGSEQPVAPSLTMSVYIISTIAAALRWLVAIDASGRTA